MSLVTDEDAAIVAIGASQKDSFMGQVKVYAWGGGDTPDEKLGFKLGSPSMERMCPINLDFPWPSLIMLPH